MAKKQVIEQLSNELIQSINEILVRRHEQAVAKGEEQVELQAQAIILTALADRARECISEEHIRDIDVLADSVLDHLKENAYDPGMAN